jgi:hypothetical protein
VGASIEAIRESATDTDSATSLLLRTAPDGGTLATALRLYSTGKCVIGGNTVIGTDSDIYSFEVNKSLANEFLAYLYNSNGSSGAGLKVRVGNASTSKYALYVQGAGGGDIYLTVRNDGKTAIGGVSMGNYALEVTGGIQFTTGLYIYTGGEVRQLLGAAQNHIADADGTLSDITTKFNTLLSELEAHGLIKSV